MSRAKDNLVVQLLLGALLSGIVIPWAIAQFRRGEGGKAKPARRAPRKRSAAKRP